MTAVYRVVVRGQFSDLDDDLRARLLAEAADHDLFRSAFTAEGTFTYDELLIAFNLRYEIRVPEDALGTTSGPERNDQSDAPSGDVGRVVEAEAMTRATQWLTSVGIAHKHLRATATDLSTMWNQP